MRTYHLTIETQPAPRSIAFAAESPDHALQIVDGEPDGIVAELWEGEIRLARLTKAGPKLWKLHPLCPCGSPGHCGRVGAPDPRQLMGNNSPT